MQPHIPSLLIGISMIIIGVIVLAKRSPIATSNASAQRAFFGKQGERVARNSTPAQVAVVGVFAILLGAGGIVLAFSGLGF